jgi:hypothetical protein
VSCLAAATVVARSRYTEPLSVSLQGRTRKRYLAKKPSKSVNRGSIGPFLNDAVETSNLAAFLGGQRNRSLICVCRDDDISTSSFVCYRKKATSLWLVNTVRRAIRTWAKSSSCNLNFQESFVNVHAYVCISIFVVLSYTFLSFIRCMVGTDTSRRKRQVISLMDPQRSVKEIYMVDYKKKCRLG